MRALAPLLVLAATAPAQLTIGVATPTGLATLGSAGGVPVAQTLPAGALPANGQLENLHPALQYAAAVTWSASTAPIAAAAAVYQQAFVAPGAPGAFALCGPHDFLFTVGAAAPTGVRAEISLELDVMSGPAPAVLAEVDVFDNGSVEFTQVSPYPPASVYFAAGGTPASVPIRVRTGMLLNVPGGALLKLQLRFRPENGIQVTPAVIGCAGSAGLTVWPSFVGAGVELLPDAASYAPMVLVLGLTPQVLPLGSFAGVPCLLYPSPDLLELRVDQTPFALAIPPAVRPVDVWAQGVYLAPLVRTTTGYRVQAW